MSDHTATGWSTPALYSGRDRVIEPRTFGGLDPMASGLGPGWDDPAQDDQWGTITYIGPRRLRPGTRPAAESLAAARAATDHRVGSRGTIGETAGGTVGGTVGGTAGDTVGDAAARPDQRLLSNTRAMALASLISRITGFLRTSLLAAALGVFSVGDAYNIANNLPNMVYELLLGGVLSSVLIPLLVHAQQDDADGGVAYTQRLMSIATVALAAVTLLAVAAAPLLATGFVHAGPQRSLATLFAMLLLPEIFFYGLGAMFMAVLNIRHSYAAGAWSPVLNNVVMIVTVAVFIALPGPDTLTPTTITTTQTLVIGIGTSLGIAAQALVLVPALRATGFRWKWRFRARPHEVGRMREVGTLALWVLGYVVASQVGVTVIASVGGHHRGAFTAFTYADLLLQMPYGILVVSLLTALMPRLSRAAAQHRRQEVVADLGLGARLSALALLPITAGLLVLSQVLTISLFAHGQVSVPAARLIGTALAASAFGLFPFALVMLQLRVFYAMRDGRTPTMINVCMVATKVAIVLVATRVVDSPAQVAVCLTVATSASYVVGAVVGHLALSRRLGRLGFARVARTVIQVATASLVGGAAAWGLVRGVSAGLGDGRTASLVALVVAGCGGLAVFAAAVWRMQIGEVREISALVRSR